jgi:hypothetical protein
VFRTKGLALSKSGPLRPVRDADPELALGRFQLSVPKREKHSQSDKSTSRPISEQVAHKELPPLKNESVAVFGDVSRATPGRVVVGMQLGDKPQGRFPAWKPKKLNGVARMQLAQGN